MNRQVRHIEQFPPGSRICKECNHAGKPRVHKKGDILLGLALLVVFLIPGIWYFIWRESTAQYSCPKCKSLGMIELNTAQGRRIYNRIKKANKPAGGGIYASTSAP